MRMPAISPVTALVGCTGAGWTCWGGSGVVFSAVLTGLGLAGIARSFGEGVASVFTFSWTGAGLGFSEVRTPVSRVRCFGGSGSEVTMVAWIAPAAKSCSPQLLPRLEMSAQARIAPMTAACRTIEPAKLLPRLSEAETWLRLELGRVAMVRS